MNKKLLLGALIGAGMSLLNKKRRQQENPKLDMPPPDFSRVPPPNQRGVQSDSASLDDIFGKLGQGGATATPGGAGGTAAGPGAAAAGGIGVFAEIARQVFQQMQQQSGGQKPGGAQSGGQPGGALGDILGQIFARNKGKFAQPGGGAKAPDSSGQWGAGLFQFVDEGDRADEQADLMLRAMVAAAQADGRIDPQEQQNIVGALQEQLDPSELDEFRQLLVQPIDMESIVSQVNDPATAFNLYLVSAMTINEDNPREKQYMDSLAEELGISERAAQIIEQQVPR
ncbi:DUF533 domain-containing protein [Microbulbifer flavimaris]|uniref:DUF533 domain-containing protein n=1 Tax=Microbulbifer flavimaris TaxID=1781068 RepID=A0ABX4HZR6_9GAMM|nr:MULTISPECIES: DUF533 domain-containing protein [Microbulbifer]KUJ83007.1 hypothetical protein AVO43_10710 [Microbulbifer sp. ZGT114]PCO05192.1 DUF533 domain-containing protein [Microbulbifer flavimaris]